MDKFKNFLLNRDFIFRIIIFFLSSFLFSTYPLIIFVIYMYTNHFFSYDFFIDGLLGMNIFFIFIFFLMLFFVLFLGWYVVYVPDIVYDFFIRLKNKNLNFKKLFKNLNFYFKLSIFICYVIFYVILYLQVKKSPELVSFFWFVLVFSLLFPIHYGILLSSKIKKIYSLIYLIFLYFFSIFFLFIHSNDISSVVSLVLSKFNVGNKKVIITDFKSKKILIKGELIFLSPSNIYLIQENNGSKILNIFERKDVLIEIKDKLKKDEK